MLRDLVRVSDAVTEKLWQVSWIVWDLVTKIFAKFERTLSMFRTTALVQLGPTARISHGDLLPKRCPV